MESVFKKLSSFCKEPNQLGTSSNEKDTPFNIKKTPDGYWQASCPHCSYKIIFVDKPRQSYILPSHLSRGLTCKGSYLPIGWLKIRCKDCKTNNVLAKVSEYKPASYGLIYVKYHKSQHKAIKSGKYCQQNVSDGWVKVSV
jgi:DNA-directed RNA polymerase subunit RPC12/RpoP